MLTLFIGKNGGFINPLVSTRRRRYSPYSLIWLEAGEHLQGIKSKQIKKIGNSDCTNNNTKSITLNN
jgi:hypothetical protein